MTKAVRILLTMGLVVISLIPHLAVAEQVAERPLYIIFDGSNSMWGELPDKSRKIEAAKKVFEKLDATMFEGREVALRLYGHRRASDCSDTELAVPFSSAQGAKARLAKAINTVTPRGKTPISRSLTAALEDFGDRSGEILLISDGIETCDADPCELVESWREKNIDIRVHVVGLGLNDLARGAMQCISEASGTNYMDANNVGELSKAIETTAKSAPPPPREAQPKPQPDTREFKIVGQDAQGNFLPVKGMISGGDIESQEIKSNFRYVFAGGDYQVNVGVPTSSGEIYKPVTKAIKIKDVGTTKITVTLTRPPMVKSRFMQNGEEVRGTTAYAYADDSQRHDHILRTNEEHFVMPGTYEYRANLRTDNSDLRSTATVVDGQDTVVVFDVIETVHNTFVVFDERTGKKVRQHQELWQDGKKKYKVHHANGKKIKPGVYTLKSQAAYTPYQIDNIEIESGEKKKHEFRLKFGSAKLFYRFKQVPEKLDSRCWVYRVDENGKTTSRGRMLQCDGREFSLSDGRYFVSTNSYYGKFTETYFDINNSESVSIDIPLIE